MWILLIGLVVLALFVALLRKRRGDGKQEKPVIDPEDMECCGQHEVCEKESLLAAISKSIEYYDDEELDEYRGIHSDQYSNEQIEAFQEVFYTMRETDVAGWIRSLQLRGVELPNELKGEVYLVVGERRMTPHLKGE